MMSKTEPCAAPAIAMTLSSDITASATMMIADRGPDRGRGGRLFGALFLPDKAKRDHQQNRAAGDLDERNGQRLQTQQREKDAKAQRRRRRG